MSEKIKTSNTKKNENMLKWKGVLKLNGCFYNKCSICNENPGIYNNPGMNFANVCEDHIHIKNTDKPMIIVSRKTCKHNGCVDDPLYNCYNKNNVGIYCKNHIPKTTTPYYLSGPPTCAVKECFRYPTFKSDDIDLYGKWCSVHVPEKVERIRMVSTIRQEAFKYLDTSEYIIAPRVKTPINNKSNIQTLNNNQTKQDNNTVINIADDTTDEEMQQNSIISSSSLSSRSISTNFKNKPQIPRIIKNSLQMKQMQQIPPIQQMPQMPPIQQTPPIQQMPQIPPIQQMPQQETQPLQQTNTVNSMLNDTISDFYISPEFYTKSDTSDNICDNLFKVFSEYYNEQGIKTNYPSINMQPLMMAELNKENTQEFKTLYSGMNKEKENLKNIYDTLQRFYNRKSLEINTHKKYIEYKLASLEIDNVFNAIRFTNWDKLKLIEEENRVNLQKIIQEQNILNEGIINQQHSILMQIDIIDSYMSLVKKCYTIKKNNYHRELKTYDNTDETATKRYKAENLQTISSTSPSNSQIDKNKLDVTRLSRTELQFKSQDQARLIKPTIPIILPMQQSTTTRVLENGLFDIDCPTFDLSDK